MNRSINRFWLAVSLLLSVTVSAKSLHPDIQLLDSNNNPVTSNEQTISAQKTCGECHSTSHINQTLSSVHKRSPDQVQAEIGLLFAMGQQPTVPFSSAEADCLSCHLRNSDIDLAALAIQGWLSSERIALGRPTAEQCGACHATVHNQFNEPFSLTDGANVQATLATGQVYSGQKISQSGLNVRNKNSLSRSFDVHAERVLECADCHGASNNPAQVQIGDSSRPEHLQFDPRRLDYADYLSQPSHDFHDTKRECVDCHESQQTHNWLPYAEQHFTKLACESCHIPQLFAPAVQLQDWAFPFEAQPIKTVYRGLNGNLDAANSLVTGFKPLLLPNDEGKLAPVNLTSILHWRSNDRVLTHDEVFTVTLGELAEPLTVRHALEQAGYTNLTLQLDVLAKPIHHNVTAGRWVTQQCTSCHTKDSLLLQPMTIADQLPADTTIFLRTQSLTSYGEVNLNTEGSWQYQLNNIAAKIYVMGSNNFWWVDVLGLLMVFGVLGLAGVHGTLRYLAWRQRGEIIHRRERVYMYTLYERLWHWLQALVILLLIFTGAVIHRPDLLGMFSFSYMVQVHNVLAFILVVNAALALFYNLSNGHIKQFLPMPNDLFVKSFIQLQFYLKGIFKGDAHPFEKSLQSKLNPMQKVAYFGLLNFLLPAQVITGSLMWGAQRWPEIANALGGLLWLGPIHSLLAWAFLAFIFMHVYLTTTSGPKPMSGIKAMVDGWEDIEVSEEKKS